MSNYSVTKARIYQWIGILLLLAVFAGAYWYFQVRASTLNQSKNDLVTNGLVGLWSFNGDDISSTTAYDRSGNANNGTLTGGPTKVIGKVGQTLNFDGTNDYVDVGDSFYSDVLTVCAWVNADTIDASTRSIIVKRNSSGITPGTNEWSLSLSTSGANFTSWQTDSITSLNMTASPGFFATGLWYHLCGVQNGNGNPGYVYINGVQSASAAQGSVMGNTTDRIQIGVETNGDSARFWDGKIDEARVYNRALSATEIQSLYDQGGGTKVASAVSQTAGTGRLDSGLAGYWKLDETTGSSASDSSTNGNTGTLVNMENGDWTTGQIGNGLDFDGVDEYVTIPDAAMLRPENRSYTVAVWAKPDNINQIGPVVTKRQNGGSSEQFYMTICGNSVCGSSGKKLYFSMIESSGGNYRLVVSANDVADGNWHHLVATANQSTNTVDVYVDGVLASGTKTSNGSWPTVNNTDPLRIGSDNGSLYYNGAVDEVRTYNRALSEDEILQLYRLTTPTGTDTGLKGYWSFNGQDMSGTTAYDRSGAGNNGTLTGGPTKTIGIAGQGVDFDGSNDYISVADTNVLDGFSDLSLSGWFNRDTFTTDDTIIAKKNSSAIGDAGYIAYIDATTDQLIFKISDGTNEYSLTSKTAFTASGWNFFTVSWANTGPSGSRMYINGLDNNATHNAGTWSISDDPTNALVLALGAESDAGGPFDGKLDEIRLYTGTLTSAQAKALYDASAPDKGNSSASQPQGTGRLDSGLAGYWKLDENTGTSASDASTNGNTGTLTNGPTWTTGQIGSAVDFDGVDDYVTAAGSTSSANITGPLTVSAWIKPGTNSGNQYIVGKWNGATLLNYLLRVNTSGTTVTFFVGDGNVDNGASGTVSVGAWSHVVGLWDGVDTKIYINGVFVAKAATPLPPDASGTSLFFGQGSGSGGGPYNGDLDEVRVYNRALSADEVGQLYRLTTPTGMDTSLKGYWSFNGTDMSGTTAYDRSGSSNTGTLSGATKVPGKIGQGLSFDGTDDYIASVANSSAVAALTQGSFAFWIKPRGVSTQGVIFRSGADGGGNSPTSGFEISGDLWAGTQTIRFMTAGSTGDMMARSTTTLVLNTWTHVVVVWDGTLTASNVKFYQNGVLDTTATQFNGSGSYVASDGSFSFGIPDGAGYRLDGILDEFRIYNRQLSADEVVALYNSSR